MIRLLVLMSSLVFGQSLDRVPACFESRTSLAYFMQRDVVVLGNKPMLHGVYSLIGTKVLQKVNRGYLLTVDFTQGFQPGLPVFLEINLPMYPELRMDRGDFAQVIGDYDYVALDGFTHRVPRLKWYQKDVNRLEPC